MLTKKRLLLLTVVLTAVYFIPLILLPESIIGARSENLLLFVPKIAFLSFSAAVATSVVVTLIFKRNFIKGQMVAFNKYKHYLRLLVKRDFISRYRKSVFGVLWSLFNPLLTMLVLTMVFSYLFRFEIENFPVYLLSGQIIFGFFSESTNLAMSSIINSEGIINKVYIPKYIFPLSRVLSSLVNLGFSFLAFLLVFVFTGAEFRLTMFLIPVPIIYLFLFSVGISMLLSSLAVFFRDITYLYGVFITLLIYLTPLFYPVEALPAWVIPILSANPIYHFVDYFRELTLYGTVPSLWANIVCIGFTLAAFLGGTYVFMSKQERFILNM